jgi:sphinganine-1-phosphate aldolase
LHSLRNIIFVLFILRWTRITFYQLKGRGIFGSIGDLYVNIRRYLYGVFLRLPGVRDKVHAQVAESLLKLERKLVPSGPGVERHTTLPREGWSEEEVRNKLNELSDMEHTRWEDGRVSGAVYHGGDELIRLQTEAFGKFTVANPIHPDVFPGVRKMEAEIVAMVCKLHGLTVQYGRLTKYRFCLCSTPQKMQRVSQRQAVLNQSSWPACLHATKHTRSAVLPSPR